MSGDRLTDNVNSDDYPGGRADIAEERTEVGATLSLREVSELLLEKVHADA